ncbi:MAG: hypothetical protein IT365_17450 [Candidatus Hydrogenedentes bacterium]|nr:hypothetical protein [Candidatus Hydrogenedentota bacterium]
MMMLWPEYCTDWNIYKCPSDVDSGPLKNGADVALRTSYDKNGLLRTVGTGWAGTNYPVASKVHLASNNDCEASPNDCYAYGADWSYSYWGVLFDPLTMRLPADSAAIFLQMHRSYTDTPRGMGCLGNQGKDYEMPVALTDGSFPTIKWLKEGIERFLITDINNPAGAATAQSGVSVMWDTIRTSGTSGAVSEGGKDFCHLPGGANILFMDGHVEFSKYPSDDGSKYWVTSHALLSDSVQYSP